MNSVGGSVRIVVNTIDSQSPLPASVQDMVVEGGEVVGRWLTAYRRPLKMYIPCLHIDPNIHTQILSSLDTAYASGHQILSLVSYTSAVKGAPLAALGTQVRWQ